VHAAFGGRVSSGRLVDLKAEARLRLEEAGVATVHDAALCTLCAAPGLLFSHRRGDVGRQAGVAWLVR
jgi:copper oxidase (laccase) domain-containing protein